MNEWEPKPWQSTLAHFLAGNKWLWIAFMSIGWLLLTDEERDDFNEHFKKIKERANQDQ